MARQPGRALQLSARRFWARRMAHALVRRDVAMVDDPMRAQSRSLTTGCVLATILVGGCAVLAVLRPQGTPGTAPIVMARESGAVYVRIGDVLHPAFNLASARLVARTPAAPVVVAQAAIERVPRGPRVGIATAPDVLGAPLGEEPWTVCDADRTVVGVRLRLPALDSARYALVAARSENMATTYLLYDGWRARVDRRERSVLRALRLDGVVPMPVSHALLDTVPEAPPISAPSIAGAGRPGPPTLGGPAIGAVVRVARSDAEELYVVLADGVQRVGPVAADVIRFAYGATDDIVSVAPAVMASVKLSDDLPVGSFPLHARTPVGARDGMLVCAQWRRGDAKGRSNTAVLTGDRRHLDAVDGTALAQADGEGPHVDAVALPAGRSAYARSARVFGDDGASGPRFVLADSGVLFGVPDDATASYLGLVEPARPAPWSILAHLPHGPELSSAAASVARDGLPPA